MPQVAHRYNWGRHSDLVAKQMLRLYKGEVEPHQSQLFLGYFCHIKQWYVAEKAPTFSKRRQKCRVLYVDYSKDRCLHEALNIWKTNPLRYHFS